MINIQGIYVFITCLRTECIRNTFLKNQKNFPVFEIHFESVDFPEHESNTIGIHS